MGRWRKFMESLPSLSPPPRRYQPNGSVKDALAGDMAKVGGDINTAMERERMNMIPKEWLLKYLAPLKGAQIVDVQVNEDAETGDFPVLVIETVGGERMELEISQDEEGNGPGFVHGLPRPK